MFLDANDWVDVCLVEVARRMIPSECAGGLIDQGLVIDFRTLQCAAVLHPRFYAPIPSHLRFRWYQEGAAGRRAARFGGTLA
jgi:hypothetical protein